MCNCVWFACAKMENMCMEWNGFGPNARESQQSAHFFATRNKWVLYIFFWVLTMRTIGLNYHIMPPLRNGEIEAPPNECLGKRQTKKQKKEANPTFEL